MHPKKGASSAIGGLFTALYVCALGSSATQREVVLSYEDQLGLQAH